MRRENYTRLWHSTRSTKSVGT